MQHAAKYEKKQTATTAEFVIAHIGKNVHRKCMVLTAMAPMAEDMTLAVLV